MHFANTVFWLLFAASSVVFGRSTELEYSTSIASGILQEESAGKNVKSNPQGVRPAGIWFGVKTAPKKKSGTLRIASYNVEKLFDSVVDTAPGARGNNVNDPTTPERLEALANAIRELDADVLCLEEVESKATLEWFRDKYLSNLDYKYSASEDVGCYGGIEQSVLSRVPIKNVKIWPNEDLDDMCEKQASPEEEARLKGEWASSNSKQKTRFSRSPLMVDLETKDGYAFTVLCVHCKAGAFAHQRELEVLKIEMFVKARQKADPKINLVVLGDFNATSNDMSVKVLLWSECTLHNADHWRELNRASPDLHITHASNRAISFMILTKGMKEDLVPNSYFVLGTLHPADDWDYKKAKEIPPPPGYASDHYPIAMEIQPKKEGGHHKIPKEFVQDSPRSQKP